jgi:hypothetical protein
MIYVTSAKSLSETLPIIGACNKYDTYEDAKNYAESFVKLRGQPCYIYVYIFEEVETIEPEQTFRLEFQRIETDQIDVKASDLSEAIKTARPSFPANEWELVRSHLIEKESN